MTSLVYKHVLSTEDLEDCPIPSLTQIFQVKAQYTKGVTIRHDCG